MMFNGSAVMLLNVIVLLSAKCAMIIFEMK